MRSEAERLTRDLPLGANVVLWGVPAAEGDALVMGIDPSASPRAVRARLGYMPESECTIPGLFGVDAGAFLGRLAGMPRRDAFKRAHEVMYFVGLGEERYRDASEYSTGMQQRLKLAAALVHDPELLFVDEPTNGLDPAGRVEMLTLLRELAREHGKHLLLSSHLLPDVDNGGIDQNGLFTVPPFFSFESCEICVTDTANTDINTGVIVQCCLPIEIRGG